MELDYSRLLSVTRGNLQRVNARADKRSPRSVASSANPEEVGWYADCNKSERETAGDTGNAWSFRNVLLERPQGSQRARSLPSAAARASLSPEAVQHQNLLSTGNVATVSHSTSTPVSNRNKALDTARQDPRLCWRCVQTSMQKLARLS